MKPVGRFCKFTHLLAFAVINGIAASALAADAVEMNIRVNEAPVEMVVREISTLTGRTLEIDAPLDGRISGQLTGTLHEALAAVADQTPLVFDFDETTLRVADESAKITSSIVTGEEPIDADAREALSAKLLPGNEIIFRENEVLVSGHPQFVRRTARGITAAVADGELTRRGNGQSIETGTGSDAVPNSQLTATADSNEASDESDVSDASDVSLNENQPQQTAAGLVSDDEETSESQSVADKSSGSSPLQVQSGNLPINLSSGEYDLATEGSIGDETSTALDDSDSAKESQLAGFERKEVKEAIDGSDTVVDPAAQLVVTDLEEDSPEAQVAAADSETDTVVTDVPADSGEPTDASLNQSTVQSAEQDPSEPEQTPLPLPVSEDDNAGPGKDQPAVATEFAGDRDSAMRRFRSVKDIPGFNTF
ncbi:MAG: hypothetical protein KTR32_23115 [Granulosicoccus sp.]|nr:hypothetical protein [Granulosicoccus sp.]